MVKAYCLILVLLCVWSSSAFLVKMRVLRLPAAPPFPLASSLSELRKWRRLTLTEKDDHNNETPQTIPGGLSGNVVVYALAFVAFWPLLALVRASWTTHDQTVGFDIDSYMALKGMLDASQVPDIDEIRELPPLSPAEQMVGALFGPPSR